MLLKGVGLHTNPYLSMIRWFHNAILKVQGCEQINTALLGSVTLCDQLHCVNTLKYVRISLDSKMHFSVVQTALISKASHPH